MEKDYFLDRPEESKYFDELHEGDEVFICVKAMQPYAEKLEDLDRIRIAEHLTTVKFHSMGQKVGGYDVRNGYYKKGRVVYLVRDNCLVTKNGLIPLDS